MKLYTKTGDDGTTALFGGQRVDKDHPRVAAYGVVDELNACLGWIRCVCPQDESPYREWDDFLRKLQSQLFDLGADLATSPGSKHEDKIRRVGEEDIAELEKTIDSIESGNTPMKQFILPGGTELAARIHIARTVCRRAERAVVTMRHQETVPDAIVMFLNRLSDLLFALARRANAAADVPDDPWEPQTPPSS